MEKSIEEIELIIDGLMFRLRELYDQNGVGYSYEKDPNAEDYRSNLQMLEYFYYRQAQK